MSPHIISLLPTFHEVRRAHATGSVLLHALRTGVKAGAHPRFDRPFNGAVGQLTSLVVKALLLLAVSSTVTIALGAGVFAAQMDDDHGNTIQTSTDLPLDTSVQGRLETSDDIDFFKIDLSREAGPTRLRIFTDGELYTSGQLYYDDGSEFGYGDYFFYYRGYNFHISATLQSGIYYITVESYYGQTGDYEIRAEKPPPDDHSDEIEGSTDVALNSSTSGRIEPFDDQDVFKLDLSGASSATEVRIYTSGDLDTIGELYDDDEELIAYSDDSGGRRRFNFSIRAAMTPGVYYVFVRGFYFDIGDYTLHIDTVPSDDHGQTFATATNVTMESSTQGNIDAQDDNDFFVLDLTANTRPMDVWIYTTGDVDTVGYLYNNSEELIAAADDLAYNVFKGSEFNFHILENLPAEVYYINVRGYRPQPGEYTLHIKGVPPDDHGNDADNPSTLALGSSATWTVDTPVDVDVFTLDLSSASDMTDLWVYTTGDLDTIAAIYDADGGFETYGDDISPDDERNTHLRAILSPGVYNIWLTGYGTETGDYTLVAEVAPTAGTSLSSARTLALGEAVPGTIDLSGDPNYHRLNVSHRKDFKLVIGSADGESIDVEVLDSKGNEIEVNVYPIYGVSFFFLYILGMSIEDDFTPGSYYLKVTAPTLSNEDLGRRQSIQDDKSRSLLDTIPGYKDATPKHYIIYDPQPVQYTILPSEDKAYTAFIEDCRRDTRALNVPNIKDPLYGCQWHLNNPGGRDVNVESAWSQGIMGEGVNVAVVDNGMDSSQIDLKDNVDVDSNHDYTGQGDIYDRFAHHGTHTAGIIAARDNDVGVRGVAPRATIYGYNLLAYLTITNLLDATTRGRDKTAVSNNSWGLVSGAWPVATDAFWEAAVESGLSEGNYGKGTFYVFSAGNGHRSGSSSNLDEFTNFYGVTAVCAVNDQDVRSQYSETGANLWVCAPSNDIDDDHRGILTTENSDRYHEDFGGTSAAAPIVAGTAALMRSANPDLTWRDLKLILAGTARKNDTGNSGWEDGAHKYGSDSERYHFNNEYGFGVVDAGAAVDLAKMWINVSPLEDSAVEASDLGMIIPDAPETGTPTSVTSSLSVDTDIGFTEYVEVTVGVEHTYFRDLDIELVSPSGAVSKLADHIDTYAVPVYGKLRLGSARFLGEDPNGVWQLRITDQIPVIEGSLDSWALKIYGHQRIPGPPTVDWATAGTGSLTVGWTPPHQTGGLPVASYDIRYIPSDSSDKSDPNWVTLEGVWTKAVGGNLEHTIPALGDNVRYDVQVRAVNSSTTGTWSKTLAATTNLSPCSAENAVALPANEPGLLSDCNALLLSRGLLAGSATLNWSANTPMTQWDGVTIEGQRVTIVNLNGRGLNGKIPYEIGSLVRMEWLYLHNNDLGGDIPAALGNVDSLRRVFMHGNNLEAEIPGQLIGLPSLELLYLNDNNLTGEIPSDLGDLSNGTRLRRLDLSDNRLTGSPPAELGKLTSLELLDLSQNNLSGGIPHELASIPKLEELYLAGNMLAGCIPAALRTLSGHDFDNLDLKFCDFDALVALYNATGGADWTNNTDWLSDKPIGDWYGVEVGAGSRVTELRLWDNGLDGDMPADLDTLEHLRVLDLGRNELTGVVHPGLGDLTDLEALDLENNAFDGPIPPALGNLSNLRSLGLRNNDLSGRIPTELASLSDLEYLTLAGNQFVGCIPAALREVPHSDLYYIDMPYCDVALANLTVTPGTLSPAFSPDQSQYKVIVDSPRVTINAVNDHNATVQFHQYGTPVRDADSSTAGHQVDLSVGANTITISLTSADGRATHSYTIVVIWDRPPPPPSTINVTQGAGSLVIDWVEATRTISSAVTAYDLRFIRSDADESVEANWTVLERVWVQDIGQLEYYVIGLADGVRFDLQMRAVNIAGKGAWSSTVTATTRGIETSVCVLEGAVADSANTALVRDCENLLFARNVLSNAGYVNWSPRTPIADWDGVTVGGSPQRVTGLEAKSVGWYGRVPYVLVGLDKLEALVLANNGLSGHIPGDFGSLSNLRELDLSGNSLVGPIPEELGGLGNLQTLDLSSNSFAGTIPTGLGNLTNLRRLDLGFNELTGPLPQELADLSNLQELSVQYNRLTGEIPTGLSRLASLRHLDLSVNGLSGPIPAELGELSGLETLIMGHNRFTGPIPAELSRLTDLRTLQIHAAGLTGPIPAELGDLSNLENLRLSGNRLTDEIPPRLGRLRNLQTLNLSDNELTGPIPAELGALSKLESLYLSFNQLTGPIPLALGRLSALEQLNLYDNQLSGEIPPELGRLSNLTTLRLPNNRLTGRIPSALGSLSNLEELTLAGNELNGAIPAGLGRLTKLVSMDLTRNRLTGPIPPELGTLANLRAMYLRHNLLSGEIPPELGSLSNLEALLLSENELTGKIPEALAELSKLNWLELAGNQLTGCIPTGLRDVNINDLHLLDMPFCDLFLSSLRVGPRALTPEFDPNHTEYTTISGLSRITVEAVVDGAGQVRYENGIGEVIADADQALDGLQIDIGAGATAIRIVLLSEDGLVLNTYTVTVTYEDLLTRYDANGDGAIDRDEVTAAISDYFSGHIGRDEVTAVIKLYFSS